MKKTFSVILTLILLVSVIPSSDVLASSKETKAKTSYNNWLKNQSNKAYFTLADLNSDGISELLYTEAYGKTKTFNSDEGSISVYTYSNGEVMQIGELSSISNYSIYYSNISKKYVAKYSYGDTVIGYETITINSNNQVETKNNYSVTYQVAQADYMKDGDIITQKEYYKYVNANYYIFDGVKFNSSKFKIVKSYKNTNTNRNNLTK